MIASLYQSGSLLRVEDLLRFTIFRSIRFFSAALGCWLTLFEARLHSWNSISYRSIGSAPVRGGTYFLCCCKESKQRKQLFWQQSQTGNALAELTGAAPKCRPQRTDPAWCAH